MPIPRHRRHTWCCLRSRDRHHYGLRRSVRGREHTVLDQGAQGYSPRGSEAHVETQEVDVGLAADIGTLARLPKIAGNQSLVYELAFTARDFGAGEAEKMGLVSRVVPGGRDEVVQAALQLAGVIAKKSPIAVLTTKKVLQHAREHT